MAYVKNSLNQEFSILMALVCEASELFQMYDPCKVAVSVSRSRSPGKIGVWAYVQSLERVRLADRAFSEAKYLMNFVVPRFFHLSPKERLETVVHEIYHLHPTLDGKLRTFAGPFRHHGPTPAAFKRRVSEITTKVEKNFPEILKHPLLNEESDQFMSRPIQNVKVMQPEKSPLWRFWIFLIFFWSSFLFAQKIPEKVTAIKAGNLFDKPQRFAIKKGKIEIGDELERLSQSPTGSWTLVRLLLTSEEGWYPSSWIKVEQSKVPELGKKWASEIVSGFYWGDPLWSVGANFYYNSSASKTFTTDDSKKELNLNRFQWGPEFHFVKAGSTLISSNSVNTSVSTRWLRFGMGSQYVIQFLDSPWNVNLAGSVFYFSRSISAPGLTPESLSQVGLSTSQKGVGFSASTGLGVLLQSNYEFGIRLGYLNMKNSSGSLQGVIGVLF